MSTWTDDGLAAGSPPLLSPPPPDALSFAENRATSSAVHETSESVKSYELRATEKTGGLSTEPGEDSRVGGGRAERNTTICNEESYGRYPRRAPESSAQGRRASPVVSDQRQINLTDGEANIPARYQGWRSGSEKAGRSALMTEERARFDAAEGRGQENEHGGVGEDAAEVSLDLSDCSEEVRVLGVVVD